MHTECDPQESEETQEFEVPARMLERARGHEGVQGAGNGSAIIILSGSGPYVAFAKGPRSPSALPPGVDGAAPERPVPELRQQPEAGGCRACPSRGPLQDSDLDRDRLVHVPADDQHGTDRRLHLRCSGLQH